MKSTTWLDNFFSFFSKCLYDWDAEAPVRLSHIEIWKPFSAPSGSHSEWNKTHNQSESFVMWVLQN